MKKFLLALCLTMVPVLAHGATYYVTTAGRDSNSCSSAQSRSTPKLSINAGIGCLQGGDTLIIGSGIYNEVISTGAIPSGAPGAHTVLQAEVRRGAILQPAFNTNRLLSFGENGANQHYITVDGLVFDGSQTGRGVAAVVFSGQYGSGDIVFQNNEVRNFKGQAQALSTAFALFYTYPQTGTIIRGNLIHDIGVGDDESFVTWAYGIYLSSSGLTFENNEIYNTSGFAIHGYSSGGDVSNNIVRNNYIHDTGAALLMCHNGNQIYNNVLVRVSAGGPACPANNAQCGGILIGGNCSGVPATNNLVYNNTVYQSRGDCIRLSFPGGTSASNNTVRNNICYQNGNDAVTMDSGSGNSISNNLLGQNPLFANAAAGDFHLQNGSPAIDAGVVMPGLSFNGSAPALGALESGADGQFPAPTRLRLVGN